jgi:hypothetical protein
VGHTNIIAGQPCMKTQGCILSKTAHKRHLSSEDVPSLPKRRRICSKMPPPTAYVQLRVVRRKGQRVSR